ncbi:hypothetical protein GobsT_02700 [Gemmata obscuriglobus]|uniref:Uncharacterized protein n=1 Tax=Gemmata obscuriglobus TaxID=114 RepID=A0A2Z3H9M5_9BACT|nr:hypothetical protein [Gemmata obscuriglobus]AWM41122.1 hypothetical protein C1280_31805 [Gemmata obscuriglobus]QEG25543.1 hypothetical protein GobsT_02700 [Gemmata obscuriglobus]VTR98899.1 unnamed protein product [Gemmata obscuriglobus UQM 2246]
MIARAVAIVLLATVVTSAVLAEDKDPTTKVTGTVIIPKDVASFDNRVVELRLYGINKQLADKSADLIEKIELKDFSHVTGKETKKAFTVGAKGKLDPNARYYVTAFVLKGDERTHLGQADHAKEPFNKVLTDGHPREVTIRFKEFGKK